LNPESIPTWAAHVISKKELDASVALLKSLDLRV